MPTGLLSPPQYQAPIRIQALTGKSYPYIEKLFAISPSNISEKNPYENLLCIPPLFP